MFMKNKTVRMFWTRGLGLISVFVATVFLVAGCARKTKEITAECILSEQQIADALAYGKQNAEQTDYEFLTPWSISQGYNQGQGRVTYFSPFLRVAQIGRNEAKRHHDVNLSIVKKILQPCADTVDFLIMAYGDDPTFGRRIKVYLQCDNRIIQPSYVRFPPYAEFNRDYYNVVSGEAKFPRAEIAKNSTVTVVVEIHPQEEKGAVEEKGHEHEKEHEHVVVSGTPPLDKPVINKYTFDLSKYR